MPENRASGAAPLLVFPGLLLAVAVGLARRVIHGFLAHGIAAAVGEALERPHEGRIARGLELARRSSWESTVQQVQDLIAQAIDVTDLVNRHKWVIAAVDEWNGAFLDQLAAESNIDRRIQMIGANCNLD